MEYIWVPFCLISARGSVLWSTKSRRDGRACLKSNTSTFYVKKRLAQKSKYLRNFVNVLLATSACISMLCVLLYNQHDTVPAKGIYRKRSNNTAQRRFLTSAVSQKCVHACAVPSLCAFKSLLGSVQYCWLQAFNS